MRVHVLGTRGSTPAPEPEFAGYGGHTSCIAIANDGDLPTLVIDAGTGIRRLSDCFGGVPFRGSVLLGHLHWDHTQGLPFFAAGDDDGAEVDLYAPEQGQGEDIGSVLARAMSPPHFPITPAGLRGSWRFRALEPGQHRVEGFDVLALEIPHKGGRTFGFRISDGSASIAYLSDHSPTSLGPGEGGLGEYHEAALRLSSGVDVLFHDAQHTDQEFPAKADLGHSCPGYAIELAGRSGARRLALYHHDPARTDDEIDALVAQYKGAKPPVAAARQGSVLTLP